MKTGVKLLIQRLFTYTILALTIGGLAYFTTNDYQKITDHVKTMDSNHLTYWQLSDSFIKSSTYLANYSELNNESTSETQADDLWYYEQELNGVLGELDYYASNASGEVMSRNGELLKDLTTGDAMDNYLAYFTLVFDEFGQLTIESAHGVDEKVLKNNLTQYPHDTDYPKNLTVTYGVPTDLDPLGTLMHYYNMGQEDIYVFATIPYIILTVSIAALVTLLLPFNWVADWKAVKYLLKTPLEIRAIFLGGTIFAVCFSPLLVIFTQTGYLAETLKYFVPSEYISTLVPAISYICWGALALATVIHMLFIKQPFVQGFMATILNNSIFGWIIKGFRRVLGGGKNQDEVTIEERVEIITQNIPLDLSPLLSDVEMLEQQITKTKQDLTLEHLESSENSIEHMKNWILSHSKIEVDLNIILDQFAAETSVDTMNIRFRCYEAPIYTIISVAKLTDSLNDLLNEICSVVM
ncbi:MAG: hypothetical protein ACRCS6_02360, partial [Turicibacter sp.]